MRRAVAVAGLTLLGACQPSEDPGLCESNAGAALGVEASYRFEDAPLAEGEALPIFHPPQGGIATELDIVILGAGFDTLETLGVRAVGMSNGATVAEVLYEGDGLPLECVQDGELKVRAVPVPFSVGTTLEGLDGAAVQLVVRVTRSDGETEEFAQAVTLDVTEY